ncbi:MAG: FHA domain-containing protein [Gammaproteobacteria bacterium]
MSKDLITASLSDAESAHPAYERLMVQIGNLSSASHPLNKTVLTIGRAPDNDIQLNSRFASRYHARLICDETGVVVEDLKSRNGTRINATCSHIKKLRNGDWISIGCAQFRYFDLQEADATVGSA